MIGNDRKVTMNDNVVNCYSLAIGNPCFHENGDPNQCHSRVNGNLDFLLFSSNQESNKHKNF